MVRTGRIRFIVIRFLGQKGYMTAGRNNNIVLKAPSRSVTYSEKDKQRVLEMTGEHYDEIVARYLAEFPEETDAILNPKPNTSLRNRLIHLKNALLKLLRLA